MSCLVLGVGNPLMGDDGIGLEALRRLQARWVLPDSVQCVDGGTWGMNLLHLLEEADAVLILDAIRARQPPGTLIILERDELPRLFAHKISPHQIDLQEILALAELRGGLPDRIAALGVEPGLVELGLGLSAPIQSAMPTLERAVVGRLGDWGFAPGEQREELTPLDGVWRPPPRPVDAQGVA